MIDFKEQRDKCKRILRDDPDPLTCVAIEYPPFCTKNGAYSGIFVNLLEVIANDINKEIKWTPCNWDDHEQMILNHTSFAGPAFVRADWIEHDVVTFLGFFSGVAIYRKERSIEINQVLRNIRNIFIDLTISDGMRQSYIDPLDQAKKSIENEINTLSKIRKLGVCRCFLEESILINEFGFQRDEEPLKSYSEIDPLDSVRQGIKDDNRVFITDSIIAARFKLEKYAQKCEFRPLFGQYIPIPAGFPIRSDNSLKNYLAICLRDNQHPIRKILDKDIADSEYLTLTNNFDAITWFPDITTFVRGINPASLYYWINSASYLTVAESESITDGTNIQKNLIVENTSPRWLLSTDPQQRKEKELKVLETVFSTGDAGLALFLKLADDGQIDIEEVVHAIDVTSAALFSTTLVNQGYAYFEGEAIVAKEALRSLSQKMRRNR